MAGSRSANRLGVDCADSLSEMLEGINLTLYSARSHRRVRVEESLPARMDRVDDRQVAVPFDSWASAKDATPGVLRVVALQ